MSERHYPALFAALLVSTVVFLCHIAPDISVPFGQRDLFRMCADAAVTNHVPLVIYGQWTELSTGTCAVDIVIAPGATLRPGYGQTVTLAGHVRFDR